MAFLPESWLVRGLESPTFIGLMPSKNYRVRYFSWFFRAIPTVEGICIKSTRCTSWTFSAPRTVSTAWSGNCYVFRSCCFFFRRKCSVWFHPWDWKSGTNVIPVTAVREWLSGPDSNGINFEWTLIRGFFETNGLIKKIVFRNCEQYHNSYRLCRSSAGIPRSENTTKAIHSHHDELLRKQIQGRETRKIKTITCTNCELLTARHILHAWSLLNDLLWSRHWACFRYRLWKLQKIFQHKEYFLFLTL